MKTASPEVVGPEYLVPFLHKALSTIKTDARRRPECQPPRMRIPGSNRLLYLKSDVHKWIEERSEVSVKALPSIFKGRKSSQVSPQVQQE
jgi:hypothetical protein